MSRELRPGALKCRKSIGLRTVEHSLVRASVDFLGSTAVLAAPMIAAAAL